MESGVRRGKLDDTPLLCWFFRFFSSECWAWNVSVKVNALGLHILRSTRPAIAHRIDFIIFRFFLVFHPKHFFLSKDFFFEIHSRHFVVDGMSTEPFRFLTAWCGVVRLLPSFFLTSYLVLRRRHGKRFDNNGRLMGTRNGFETISSVTRPGGGSNEPKKNQ